jgi:hypothetical protein
MKVTMEGLLAGVPPQEGNGGQRRMPSVSASAAMAAEPLTPIDKTTANARLLLNEESSARAEKTAKLKAARQERDLDRNG